MTQNSLINIFCKKTFKKYLQRRRKAVNIFNCRRLKAESFQGSDKNKLKKVLDKELIDLLKYKSCLVRPDRGSTLKTEQSFAKSVRVLKTQTISEVNSQAINLRQRS